MTNSRMFDLIKHGVEREVTNDIILKKYTLVIVDSIMNSKTDTELRDELLSNVKQNMLEIQSVKDEELDIYITVIQQGPEVLLALTKTRMTIADVFDYENYLAYSSFTITHLINDNAKKEGNNNA